MLAILLSFAITTVVAIVAYAQARAFVTRRLRYVDAVQKPFAPWLAGIGAAVIAMPLVGLLPLLGIGTALSFGFAIGAGVAAGARDVRGSLPRW